MSIEAFITIHSSDLIRECEETGRFDSVSHTYLFVGPKKVEYPKDLKVIVARDYLPNYEHLPHFYDFTGWFVLAKHDLIQSENAMFLQYDHRISNSNIAELTVDALHSCEQVSYVSSGPEWFTLAMGGFKEKQMEGFEACGVNWGALSAQKPISTWPTTQGASWNSAKFCEMMLWFEPAFNVFKDHDFAGHLAERMIPVFLMQNDYRTTFMPEMVVHESLDCHGTRDLSFGNIEAFSQKALEFGRQEI